MSTSTRRLIVMAACLITTVATVFADVAYRRTVIVSGRAARGAGGTAEIDVGISGSRLRADVECPTGLLCDSLEKMGALRPAEIVRLDEGRIYGIEPAARAVYVETLPERRARLSRIEGKREPAWPFDEVSVDIAATGGHEDIGGFPCEQTMMMIIGTLHEPGKDEAARMLLRADLWVTTSFEGKSEIEQYGEAFAAGLGADPEAALRSLFVEDRYANILGEFSRAFRRVGGFPIRYTLTLSRLASQVPSLPGGAPGSPGDTGSFAAPTASGGPGLVPPRRSTRFRQRDETSGGRGGQPLGMSPEWVLTSQIATVSTEKLPRSRFDPPEDFRRLVPKSEKDSGGGSGETAEKDAGPR